MTPGIRIAIKLVAGAVIVIGLIFGFIERFYAPTYLGTQAPHAPGWVGWWGWIPLAVGSLAYFAADISECLAKRRQHRRSPSRY